MEDVVEVRVVVDVRGLMGVVERVVGVVPVPRGETGVGEVIPRTVRGLKGAEI